MAIAQAQEMAGEPSAPIVVSVQRPENLSRLHLLLKTFFGFIYVGIPHGIILYALGIAAWVVSLAAFVVILFTGRYPKSLFNFAVAYQRWNLRVMAYAGPFLGNFMVDKYPPFSFEEEPDDPVILRVEYPENLSRPHAVLKLLLGWLYVGVPHGIILLFYGIALLIALFVVWFIILFTGRFPEAIFRFAEGYMRWGTRVNLYLAFATDKYPKFSPSP